MIKFEVIFDWNYHRNYIGYYRNRVFNGTRVIVLAPFLLMITPAATLANGTHVSTHTATVQKPPVRPPYTAPGGKIVVKG